MCHLNFTSWDVVDILVVAPEAGFHGVDCSVGQWSSPYFIYVPVVQVQEVPVQLARRQSRSQEEASQNLQAHAWHRGRFGPNGPLSRSVAALFVDGDAWVERQHRGRLCFVSRNMKRQCCAFKVDIWRECRCPRPATF